MPDSFNLSFIIPFVFLAPRCSYLNILTNVSQMKGNESSDSTRQCAVLTQILQNKNYQEIKEQIFSLKSQEKESLLMPKYYLVIRYSPNLTKFPTHKMIIWKSLAYQNLPNRNVTVGSIRAQKHKVVTSDPQEASSFAFPPVLLIVYLLVMVHLRPMFGKRVLIMLSITSTSECIDIRQN